MDQPLRAAPELARRPRVAWGHVALFVLLAFAASWALWLGLGALGVPFGVRAAVGMFGPALAATLLRGPLGHEGFGDAGLRLGHGGWRDVRPYVAAYVAVPLLLAAGLALALLLGFQRWVNPVATLATLIARQLADLHAHLPAGLSLNQLAALSLAEQVVLALTLALPINMIFTFGEEFGWRGYLLPRLAPLGGIPAVVLSGAVWGLWHTPLIVLAGYNYPPPYPGAPWLGVLMMMLFTISFGALLAWLRFRSGSVWPGALAHAAINAQAGMVVLALTPAGALLRPPVGLVGIAPMAALALWLAFTGRLRPPMSAARGIESAPLPADTVTAQPRAAPAPPDTLR